MTFKTIEEIEADAEYYQTMCDDAGTEEEEYRQKMLRAAAEKIKWRNLLIEAEMQLIIANGEPS